MLQLVNTAVGEGESIAPEKPLKQAVIIEQKDKSSLNDEPKIQPGAGLVFTTIGRLGKQVSTIVSPPVVLSSLFRPARLPLHRTDSWNK